MVFIADTELKETSLGPVRTTGPYFSWSFHKVRDRVPIRSSRASRHFVRAKIFGPGILESGLRTRGSRKTLCRNTINVHTQAAMSIMEGIVVRSEIHARILAQQWHASCNL